MAPKNVTLKDIMEKLNNMEQQYTTLLTRYEEQIKINADLKSEIAEIQQQLLSVKSSGSITTAPEIISESMREFN